MIHAPAADRPALLPALAAMTWLQALVALALFAPGAVAPSAHLDIPSLSMFSTAVFAVGVFTSFWTGGLINRLGSLRMASLCAGAVVASMAFAAFGSGSALLLAAGILAAPDRQSDWRSLRISCPARDRHLACTTVVLRGGSRLCHLRDRRIRVAATPI